MNIKFVIKILSLIAYFFSSSVFAANQVLHYAPEVVTLSGIIKIKTFPGAPNYESVEAGDDLESGPYLLLAHSIDVVKSTKDEDPNSATEKNLRIIQVTIGDNDDWDAKYIGKPVLVTGTLCHRLTGHQHTPVLIDAKHFVLKAKEGKS